MVMHVHQVHIVTYYCVFPDRYSVLQDGAKAHTVIDGFDLKWLPIVSKNELLMDLLFVIILLFV
jgi:hypothetical protein